MFYVVRWRNKEIYRRVRRAHRNQSSVYVFRSMVRTAHPTSLFFGLSKCHSHLTPLIFAVIFSRVCGSVTLAVHSSHSNVRQGSKITRSGVHNLVISPCKSSSITYCRQQLLKEISHSLTGLSIAFWSWEKCQTLTFPCLAITLFLQLGHMQPHCCPRSTSLTSTNL